MGGNMSNQSASPAQGEQSSVESALSAAASKLHTAAGELERQVSGGALLAGEIKGTTREVDSHVQNVAAAAEQMTASISEIAGNASEAAKVAQSAVVMADKTNETIAKLGEASHQIGAVIKVITSIAQQTNLLALNATIEAARAGEAGRGFAVVANEVKELAKETAEATEDIGKRIEAIQAETDSAVQANVQIGEIIRQISDIQGNIAHAVEEQSSVMTEISRSAHVTASGTTRIVDVVDDIAAAGEQAIGSARNVESLASQVRDLAAKSST